MTAPRHVDVGAYLLGILDKPDEAAYEQHFAQCEQCRREFIELADMPAFLDMLKPAEQDLDQGQQPALPPLDSLIDFKQLKPPGPGPSVPPQQRPAGATQPHKVPHPPTNGNPGPRTNGTARPGGPGQQVPTPPRAEGTGRHAPVERPGAEGTGRHAPVARADGTGRHAPGGRPQAEGTGQHRPVPRSRAEGTGQHPPAGRSRAGNGGRTASAPRAESTGQHQPPSPAGHTGHPPADRPRAQAAGEHTTHSRAESTGQHQPANRSRAESSGKHQPVNGVRAEQTGQHQSADRSRAGSTGQHSPANRARTENPAPSRAAGTGQHQPVNRARAEGTGRHTPASSSAGTSPATRSRAEGTGRSTPVTSRVDGPRSSPAKPPSKPRDPGPANRAGTRRNRKPIWVATLAVAAVALSVGMAIGLTSGDSGQQVADRNTTAPVDPPSGAVAGAHVVSGTDPDSGVTAIITLEPVNGDTKIDMDLYEIDGPQEGVLIAVTRFGDREEVASWKAPEGRAGRSEAVHAKGVAEFPQQDIIRFEVHGDGIEPLVEVPT